MDFSCLCLARGGTDPRANGLYSCLVSYVGTKDDECLRVFFALDFMVDCLWFDSLMRSTCRGDSHAGRRMPQLLDIPAFFSRVGFEMGSACACFFFLLFCDRLSSARRNDAEQMPRRFTRRERRREESQISAQAALVHPRTLPVPTCVPDTACTSIFFISHAARLPRKPYILVYIHTYQV